MKNSWVVISHMRGLNIENPKIWVLNITCLFEKIKPSRA